MPCGVCRQEYAAVSRYPRQLSCTHIFCELCLMDIKKKNDNSLILCPAPNCSQEHYIDPKNLPVINDLIQADTVQPPPIAPEQKSSGIFGWFSSPKQSGKVVVKLPNGSYYSPEVDFSITVRQLKEMIHKRSNISVDQQTLSTKLQDGKTLKHYGIVTNTRISMSVSSHGGWHNM